MQEITLRDLCRWDRRLKLTPARGMSLDAALERGVSWAVSLRASPPLLPPLRGDELLVVPVRVLAQIEEGESVTRDELLSTLVQEPIAALLTEPSFSETAIDRLPMLMLPAPFPHDAEGRLNRLITERRTELYRLGSDLSRRLSHAVLDPHGLQSLLETAAELSGRSLVLQDEDGHVVAESGKESAGAAGSDVLAQARAASGPIHSVDPDGQERLILALAAGGRTEYLSLVGPQDSLNESDRLVLNQTAGTCSIVMSQGRPAAVDRTGRDRLVADLLLGRLASDAAVLARGQMLGLDPAAPIIVGLLETSDGTSAASNALSQAFARPVVMASASIPEGTGFILQAIEADQAARSLRRVFQPNRLASVRVALSQSLSSVLEAPEGLRQARFALALCRTGAIPGPIISCADPNDLGLFSLLYPLWGSTPLAIFRQAVIGPLERYDDRRERQLIETLDAYLSTGGALAEASDRLAIHRNTLSYRLRRIEELTGRDLSDPQQRLLLQVALQIRKLPWPITQS